MTTLWDANDDSMLQLPSGRLVRGRGLRYPTPTDPLPTFGIYLLGKTPPPVAWTSRWIPWPDFWLPRDRRQAQEILREAWERAGTERVEIACGGGRGRTGTAMACLAIFDGVPPHEAVSFVRKQYHKRAVETPWQKRYVASFTAGAAAEDEER